MIGKSVGIIGLLLVAGCSSGASDSPPAAQPGGLTAEQQNYQDMVNAQEAERAEAQRVAAAYTEAVNRVLRDDAAASQAGGGHSAVAARMANIDMTGAPGDFQSAYIDHTEAWRQVGRIDDALVRLQSDDEMGPAVIGGMLATVFGSSATPFSDHLDAIAELRRRRPGYAEAINTTFATVRSVAARYDAAPPVSSSPSESATVNSM